MIEYTFLYRGRETNPSADQMQKTTEKWVAWMKQMAGDGRIVNMGHPLLHEGAVVSGTGKQVIDGPFAEAKDVVGGFTIFRAADLAEAIELAKGCPILEVDGSVEIRPLQQMQMPL
jgi:hypothetical protein